MAAEQVNRHLYFVCLYVTLMISNTMMSYKTDIHSSGCDCMYVQISVCTFKPTCSQFRKMFRKTNLAMAEVPITLSHRVHSTATAEMQPVSIVFDFNQVGP